MTNPIEWGKGLAALILSNANTQKLDEEGIELIVTAYCSSKKIIKSQDKSKTIQRALVMLHPDKIPATVKDQSETITKTLLNIKEAESNNQNNLNTQTNDGIDFGKSLGNSAFKNIKTEISLFNIADKHHSIKQWLASSTYLNACVRFGELTNTYNNYGSSSYNLLNFLVKIAVFEIVIKQVCPNQDNISVIEHYANNLSNFPKDRSTDPILWLMNEIIMDHAEVPSKALGNEIEVISKPNLTEILTPILINKNFESGVSVLKKLLYSWSSDTYLPHIKALITDMLEDAEDKKSFRCTIEEKSEEYVMSIYSKYEASPSIIEVLQLETIPSDILLLEKYRVETFHFARKLPVVLATAKFKIVDHEKGESPVSEETLGPLLQQRLSLFNSLINEARKSKGYMLEDPNAQPVLDIPNSPFLYLQSKEGIKVPYLQSLTVLNRDVDDYGRKLRIKHEDFPDSVNPEAVAILNKTMGLVTISYDESANRYGYDELIDLIPEAAIKDLFAEWSLELKNSEESKQMMLLFSLLVFNRIKPSLHHFFSECVKSNLSKDAVSSNDNFSYKNDSQSIFATKNNAQNDSPKDEEMQNDIPKTEGEELRPS